jgi:uncharacterized PurR-regulated membrane protein YhhQ (DUF165 family)
MTTIPYATDYTERSGPRHLEGRVMTEQKADIARRRSGQFMAAAAYLTGILAANYVTNRYGMVPVGFGYVATAGTYFAGLSFVLRDLVQVAGGRRAAVAVVVLGAVLSYFVSSPQLALASGVAFLVAEGADLCVYTPLRHRGYIRAAVASNIVGALGDTFLFLWLAGFPIAGAWQGQMVGKLAVTAVVIALVGVARAVLREPVNAEGA